MKCNKCKRELPNKSFKLNKGYIWCFSKKGDK